VKINNDYQNKIDKLTAKIELANKELPIKKEEKENRAEEIMIANKKLLNQTKEKAKRAADLLILQRWS
jgi:hypothetical protein